MTLLLPALGGELLLGFDVQDIVVMVFAAIYLIINALKSARKSGQDEASPAVFEEDDDEDAAKDGEGAAATEAWQEMMAAVSKLKSVAQQVSAPPSASLPSASLPSASSPRVSPALAASPAGRQDDAKAALRAQLGTQLHQATELRRRANSVAAYAGKTSALAPLAGEVTAKLLDAANDLYRQAETASTHRGGSTEDARVRLSQILRDARRVQGQLALFGRVAEERQRPEAGDTLRGLDELAEGLIQAFWRIARRDERSAPRVLCVLGSTPRALVATAEHLGLLLMPVPPDITTDPTALISVTQRIARSLFESFPALRSELAEALDADESGQMPPIVSGLYDEHVRAMLGAWLPTLFEDVLGSVMLGSSYLRALLVRLGASAASGAIRLDGPRLDATAPALVRYAAIHAVMVERGLEHEVEAIWDERWSAGGAPAQITLPLGGGARVGVDPDPLLKVVAAAGRALHTTQLKAFASASLSSLRELGQVRSDESTVARVRAALLRGERPSVRPLIAIAAAIEGAYQAPERGPAILRVLFVSSAPQRAARRRPSSASRIDLSPSPEVIADAIIFRAIFDE